MNGPNYQVVVGATNKERLMETGICIGFAAGCALKLTGKYRQLHKVIKDLNLVCYSEVEKVTVQK